MIKNISKAIIIHAIFSSKHKGQAMKIIDKKKL